MAGWLPGARTQTDQGPGPMPGLCDSGVLAPCRVPDVMWLACFGTPCLPVASSFRRDEGGLHWDAKVLRIPRSVFTPLDVHMVYIGNSV
jgi:hypothetical protein